MIQDDIDRPCPLSTLLAVSGGPSRSGEIAERVRVSFLRLPGKPMLETEGEVVWLTERESAKGREMDRGSWGSGMPRGGRRRRIRRKTWRGW
jgi:hypothetical protein